MASAKIVSAKFGAIRYYYKDIINIISKTLCKHNIMFISTMSMKNSDNSALPNKHALPGQWLLELIEVGL